MRFVLAVSCHRSGGDATGGTDVRGWRWRGHGCEYPWRWLRYHGCGGGTTGEVGALLVEEVGGDLSGRGGWAAARRHGYGGDDASWQSLAVVLAPELAPALAVGLAVGLALALALAYTGRRRTRRRRY